MTYGGNELRRIYRVEGAGATILKKIQRKTSHEPTNKYKGFWGTLRVGGGVWGVVGVGMNFTS